ncbi:hypothetical protein CRENBAI_013815, partial [Crenichthys baileyi]
MPTCGPGRDDSKHSEGCKIKTELYPGHPPTPLPPCCSSKAHPSFWTLEANIPPSALALIITKDRMHKTWRTLRQKLARSPFSPYAKLRNSVRAPLA